MHLAESTWTDAADVETDLALLPVGSTEQHGPHAPLGTDAMAAETAAEAGVEAFDGEVVLAPTVPVGVAAEHRHFAGTLWVGEDTFRDYVRETVASLAAHGWDRVVVVNGHGGNVAPLREVCGRITRRDDAYAVPFTWFEAVAVEEVAAGGAGGGADPVDGAGEPTADADPGAAEIAMGHGGAVETSLVRAVYPELVREDRLADAAAGAADAWGEWVSGTNLAYDAAEFSENGVVGDPRAADAALGERFRDAAGDLLATLLERVAARDSESEPVDL